MQTTAALLLTLCTCLLLTGCGSGKRNPFPGTSSDPNVTRRVPPPPNFRNPKTIPTKRPAKRTRSPR